MKIVEALPPNFEQIKEELAAVDGSEIFAYGDIIYNPSGGILPDYLVAHEEKHQQQQGSDVESWWRRYLDNEVFRLQQELEAHRIEWHVYQQCVKDRNMRANYLHLLSKKLAHPIYGSLVNFMDARKLITQRG